MMRYIAIFLLLFPGLSIAALPASDDFNYTENPLSNGGAWAKGYVGVAANFRTNGSVAYGSGVSAKVVSYWAADTFSNDQWSQVSLSTPLSYCGVSLRVTSNGTSTGTGYLWVYGTTNVFRMYKFSTSTYTQIGSDYSITSGSGDTLKLEVSGSTLTPYHNTVSKATQSDSTYSSGSAGISGYHNTSANGVDNWSGGDMGGGGGPVIPVFMDYYRRQRSQ